MKRITPIFSLSFILSHKTEPISLKYQRFPIGTNSEQEVWITSLCCVKSFKLIVSDVADNKAVLDVDRSKKVTSISYATIIAISIPVIIVVIILLIGFCVYLRRHHKKYGSYQFGTRSVHPTSIKKSDAIHRHIKIDESLPIVSGFKK